MKLILLLLVCAVSINITAQTTDSTAFYKKQIDSLKSVITNQRQIIKKLTAEVQNYKLFARLMNDLRVQNAKREMINNLIPGYYEPTRTVTDGFNNFQIINTPSDPYRQRIIFQRY